MAIASPIISALGPGFATLGFPSRLRSVPLATSQIVMVRLAFSVARVRLSGEKAKLAMGCGDSILRIALPVAASKSASAALGVPLPGTGAASSLPLGEKANPGPVSRTDLDGPPRTIMP